MVTIDGDYRNLLRYGQRADDNNPGTDNFTTIEFFDLTPGNTYEIQIWASDVAAAVPSAQNAVTVLGNGSTGSPAFGSDPQLFHEEGEGTIGQYCIGTFVANAPNQAFNVQSYTNLLTTPSIATRHWCNAWQIRNLGVVSGTPFGNWAAGPWSGTLGDPDPKLDFDGGGLDTGIEWVVGGDPIDASDDAGNAPTSDNSDPDFFIFTFNRRDAAHTDGNTNIAVEYGSNLSGWTTAIHDGTDVIITPTDNGAFDSLEVKLRRSVLAPGGKFFARLKVVVATP